MSNQAKAIYAFILLVTILPAQTQLTVYNHGEALVKEVQQHKLVQGEMTFVIENVAETLIPLSVRLGSGKELQILEQSYYYDLVNQNQLLKKYLGSTIDVILQNDNKINGKLLSFDEKTLVLKGRNSTDIVQRNYVGTIKCPDLKEKLYIKPTLEWRLRVPQSRTYNLELSYVARHISWKVEYIAILSDDNSVLNLSSWINLNNQSGKTYENTKLKLVAGELHRPRTYRGEQQLSTLAQRAKKAAPQISERDLFEYHLYEVGFPVTVKNKEEKQIQFLHPVNIRAEKHYVFEYGSSRLSNVTTRIRFVNDKVHGTGVSLPAGTVRLFKRDRDESLELIGEDLIKHISVDDEVTLELGKAYDIKGKREVMDRRSRQDKYLEEDIRITLVNRKDRDVVVDVIEHLNPGNWKIISPSDKFQKLDASRIKFEITVPAKSERVVSYTYNQSLK